MVVVAPDSVVWENSEGVLVLDEVSHRRACSAWERFGFQPNVDGSLFILDHVDFLS